MMSTSKAKTSVLDEFLMPENMGNHVLLIVLPSMVLVISPIVVFVRDSNLNIFPMYFSLRAPKEPQRYNQLSNMNTK